MATQPNISQMNPNENSTDEPDFRRGLPQEATPEVIDKYAIHCMKTYKNEHGRVDGETLREYFIEDFDGFSKNDFVAMTKTSRRMLRDLLRSRGVYVRKKARVEIADCLLEALNGDLAWPEDDLGAPFPATNSTLRGDQAPEFAEVCLNRTAEIINEDKRHGAHTKQDNKNEGLPSTELITQGNLGRGRISSLFKAYPSDKEKYSGAMFENFGAKLALFNERCDQSEIALVRRTAAFSTMLTGPAREFYFSSVKGKFNSMDDIIAQMRKRFETAERTRYLSQEFFSLTLSGVAKKNLGKSLRECIELLVNKLQSLQSCLPSEYQSDGLLRDRLLNSVQGVEACRIALQKPADTVEGIISDLQASAATYTKSLNTFQTRSGTEAMLVDRKFNRRDRKGKKCLVCKREGCWSTKHPWVERVKALKKNPKVKAFIGEVLDSESDNEDLADETMEVLAYILDVKEDESMAEPDIDDPFDKELSEDKELHSFATELMDYAEIHSLTKSTSPRQRYNEEFFYGIMIDTGCSNASTGGMGQYLAYCRYTGVIPEVNTNDTTACMFGIGTAKSKGVAQIRFPVGGITYSFNIHIVEADVPLLLSLADMDKIGIYYNNLKDELIHSDSGITTSITRYYGHPFIRWNHILECMFTQQELKRLHRRFGHPTTDKLYNLLRRAAIDKVDSRTRKAIAQVVKACRECQIYAQKPRRFKFTLRTDKQFNHTIFVDILKIDGNHVLHVVDEATRYQAARALPSVSAEAVWKALRMCWIDVYLGPPDVITHDAGKQFMARHFQASSNLFNMTTKPIPVESPNSLTFVERYHAPLRRAYNVIKGSLKDAETEFSPLLQMAVKSINDSVGPDGLIPTLLVYGAIPKLGLMSDKPTPGMIERAHAVNEATREMSRYFAKRQVQDAMRCRNGPNVTDIHQAPLGSHVLVYRPELDRYEGPYTLLDITGETCTILLPKGPALFRTTVVKPYVNTEGTTPQQSSNSQVAVMLCNSENLVDNSIDPCDNLEVFKSRIIKDPGSELGNPDYFSQTRKDEMQGLMQNGVFLPVNKSCANGHRIFGGRFVDELKFYGTKLQKPKSRFVIQAFMDKKHGLLTHAPTVQRSSQRLLLCIAASFKEFNFFTRDISQAYSQSESKLVRKVFVKPPKELGLDANMLLQVAVPTYGLPEAGVHWFSTYHRHHVQRLKMKPAVHDLCLLYTPHLLKAVQYAGVTCLQTDDTASAGTDEFINKEQAEGSRYKSKPQHILQVGGNIPFNGSIISRSKEEYSITQKDHIQRMALLEEKDILKDKYITQRARGGYVSSTCRPDLLFGFNYAAQFLDPTEAQFKFLNKVILRSLETANQGLNYVALDLQSCTLSVFIDASFAMNDDYTSQLGYLLTLRDGTGRTNIIHYGSSKSKRVTRSVLAAELYAMILGYDISSVIGKTISDMIGVEIPLHIYTDSKSLYDSLTTLNQPTEKRLLIDLSILREGYEHRDIDEVYWIPGHENPADGMTKWPPCSALTGLMETNFIALNPNAWIERKKPLWVGNQPNSNDWFHSNKK